jgi:hypothetical protein
LGLIGASDKVCINPCLSDEGLLRVDRVSLRVGEADARFSQAGERQLTDPLRLRRLQSTNDG